MCHHLATRCQHFPAVASASGASLRNQPGALPSLAGTCVKGGGLVWEVQRLGEGWQDFWMCRFFVLSLTFIYIYTQRILQTS